MQGPQGQSGSRVLIMMLTAGLLVAVFFVIPQDWSSSESTGKKSSSAGGSSISPGLFKSAVASCYPPNPPLSIEWIGRPSMTISMSSTKDVEVQMNDFPGSMLRKFIESTKRERANQASIRAS